MRYKIIETDVVLTRSQLANTHPHVSFPAEGEIVPDILALLGLEVYPDEPPHEPTPEELAQALQDAVVAATQRRLDDFARSRGYDNILSASTYATSAVPKFAAEGQVCVNARDATWATLYTVLGEVLAGTRPMPSGYADIAPLLPALEWPV